MPDLKPSGALVEILKQTGELDRILDGRGLSFDATGPPCVTGPLERPRLPDVDWRAEALARERELALRRPPREPDPPIHVEDVERRPAAPKSATPRLDAWKSGQVAADRGDAS